MKSLALSDWICPKCQAVHDRDLNATRKLVKLAGWFWYKCELGTTFRAWVKRQVTAIDQEASTSKTLRL